jgi:hypothetical protein
MCKSLSISKLICASFLAAAAFGVLSIGPAARAADSLSRCTGASAKQVIDCCQKIVRVQRPFWMIGTGASCAGAVVCSSSGSKAKDIAGAKSMKVKVKKTCHIEPYQKEIETKVQPSQGRTPTRQ